MKPQAGPSFEGYPRVTCRPRSACATAQALSAFLIIWAVSTICCQNWQREDWWLTNWTRVQSRVVTCLADVINVPHVWMWSWWLRADDVIVVTHMWGIGTSHAFVCKEPVTCDCLDWQGGFTTHGIQTPAKNLNFCNVGQHITIT